MRLTGGTLTIEERILGSILGLAIGDALGYPHEFRSVVEVRRRLGPDGITDFISIADPVFGPSWMAGSKHPAGTYTDDTQMTRCVLEGLIESQTTDSEVLMPAIGRHFVQWSNSLHNDRAPGATCLKGCRRLEGGTPWRAANVAKSKGCGSAMRVAPIGLYYDDLETVAQVARDSSLLTHGHPAAVEGAAAAALLVAMALRDEPPAAMHAYIAQACTSSADFNQVWQRVPQMLDRSPDEVLVDGNLGEAWVAEEAVAGAMYCFWRHETSYTDCVLEAVNSEGDSDSLGCIAGSIAGARLGVHAIPEGWRQSIEDAAGLHASARKLVMSRNRFLGSEGL
jgi:ADP-ribosylglycohydrolase